MPLFRPQKLNDIVGQDSIKEFLRITIDASQKKNEPIPHLLFVGRSGNGKTTLAQTISSERGVGIQTANGAKLNAHKFIVPYLIKAQTHSVFFIDEIHRMPIKVQEFIYPVLEESKLFLSTDRSTSELQLNKFSIIGATTNLGLLAEPFRNRFTNHLALKEYTHEQLQTIAKNNISSLNLNVSPDAIFRLSKICKYVPRTLNNYINWLNDYCISHEISLINIGLVEKAMAIIGVDKDGLDQYDRKYIDLLKRQYGEPLGLKSIASILDLSIDTVENTIEPFLLREKLIKKTISGRVYIG